MIKIFLFFFAALSLFAVPARAQTAFEKNTGEYGEFFSALTDMLTTKNPEGSQVQVRGKKYNLLVPWVRDHVTVSGPTVVVKILAGDHFFRSL